MFINPVFFHSMVNSGYNKKSFKGHVSPYSYEAFIKSSNSVGLNSANIKSQCVLANLVGSGANSKVFNFSYPELKNWVIKMFNSKETKLDENAQVKKVVDAFGDINLGQEIAQVGRNIRILKKVEGVPHSLSNWATRNNTIYSTNPVIKPEAKSFEESLKTISDFSQDSFQRYAKELKCLNDYGYKADSFNPNNLLIDYAKKDIHIIDMYKYEKDANRNSKYDLICPLLDFMHFGKFYTLLEDPSKLIESAKKIFDKCSIAAKTEGVSTSEKLYIDYIAEVDSRLNLKDLYLNSYKTLKSLCGF